MNHSQPDEDTRSMSVFLGENVLLGTLCVLVQMNAIIQPSTAVVTQATQCILPSPPLAGLAIEKTGGLCGVEKAKIFD